MLVPNYQATCCFAIVLAANTYQDKPKMQNHGWSRHWSTHCIDNRMLEAEENQ